MGPQDQRTDYKSNSDRHFLSQLVSGGRKKRYNGFDKARGCFPMDSRNFDQNRLIGERVEERGKQPTTMHMFIQMARPRSRIYDAPYRA